MLDDAMARDVATRVQHVRRRRGVTYNGWVPPPSDWPEIVRSTWPSLIRHRVERVPDGWVDIVLAFADHLEGRSIVIIDAFEDLVTGKLEIIHTWRRGQPADDDSNRILDHYEAMSASTCRVCGDLAEKVSRGVGRLARTRVLCEQHSYGETDD